MNLTPEASSNNYPVRTRRVYYISGFDPRGAGHYHRLYKEEAVKQSAHNGIHMEVGSRSRIAPHLHTWHIESQWQQHAIATDYRFLSWDDIVRQQWETNTFKLIAEIFKGYTGYAACGALGRIYTAYRNQFYIVIYPIIIIALTALLSLLVSGMLATAVAHSGGHTMLAFAAGLLALATCLRAGLKLIDRLGVPWLLRSCLFVFKWGGAPPESLKRRIDEFADIIIREQEERPCEEVLLVGHCVGTILAVSTLARILDKSAANQSPGLTLLTLGQCIPLQALIPGAAPFRRDLKLLVERAPWLDATARVDPLCFFKANPADIPGVNPSAAKWPNMHIVRPYKMFPPEKYKRVKRNKLRMHFQYLMASELQTDYDYFMMTAGPYRMPLTKS